MEPVRILKAAKSKGLGAVAIADHNTFECHAKKMDLNGMVLIPAEEITTSAGHVIGLFLNAHVPKGDFFDVADSINAQDGIIVLVHPYRKHKEIESIKDYVDVVETFNARTSDKCNKKAADFARKNKLPAIAGTDAHFYFEIGNGTTVLDADDSDDIRRMILKGGKLLCRKSPFYAGILTDANKLVKKFFLNG